MKHFLTGEELKPAEVEALLTEAIRLKGERRDGVFPRPLAGRTLAMVFEKPSLRTRLSFSIAIQELGGWVVESSSSTAKREEPEDMARVLNGYCHALMIRTHEHKLLERMLPHLKVPLINGLSDDHHPCQALADALTLRERFGELKGRTLTYLGDGNNVLHSLLLLLPSLGVSVRYACPAGYGPNSWVVKRAQARAATKSMVRAFDTAAEAVAGADAIYTDVWTSMGFEGKPGYSAEEQDETFRPFQVTEALFERAASEAIFMHCLPMQRGREVTETLPDHPRSAIFEQSENRLHVQKALLTRLLT